MKTTHQNNKAVKLNINFVRNTFIFTMAMVLYAGIVLAGNLRGKEKAELRLMGQVEQMVKSDGLDADLSGKAVVTFKVANNDKIEEVKVVSDNPALIDHVKTSMEGQTLDQYRLEHNKKIRFNLTLNDLR